MSVEGTNRNAGGQTRRLPQPEPRKAPPDTRTAPNLETRRK